jgi:hypothetical protein
MNYDGSRKALSLENAGMGRHGNQRAEDKKFEAAKDEIIAYLEKEKGVHPEASDWERIKHIWDDGKEALHSRVILSKRVTEATSKLAVVTQERDDLQASLRAINSK